MEEFPSGQRGQTVNLLRFASVVRIHPPPPSRRKFYLRRLLLLSALSVSFADSSPTGGAKLFTPVIARRATPDAAIRFFRPPCLPPWGRCPVRTLGGEGRSPDLCAQHSLSVFFCQSPFLCGFHVYIIGNGFFRRVFFAIFCPSEISAPRTHPPPQDVSVHLSLKFLKFF